MIQRKFYSVCHTFPQPLEILCGSEWHLPVFGAFGSGPLAQEVCGICGICHGFLSPQILSLLHILSDVRVTA